MASTYLSETLGFPRRAQHDALRELRLAMDDAITSPSLDETAWVSELTALLSRLERIFARHVHETEAPDGSLEEILHLKPHLSSRVRRVKEEHVALRASIAGLHQAMQQCRTSPLAINVETLRCEAGHLADAIRMHQARGVDLVYEAHYRVEGSG